MSNSKGFTLIELLIVMTIIGILASVAVPQYSEYKSRAFDTRAQSDLRNVAIAEEAYFVSYETYRSCDQKSCPSLPGVGNLSKGVLVSVIATPSGFVGTANHPKGHAKIFTWDSSKGGPND